MVSEMERVSVSVPKARFLLFMSYLYLFAFASLYIQLPGLYGKNGILPVDNIHMSPPRDLNDFLKDPSLLRFSYLLHLNVYQSLELIVLCGALISLLAVAFSYVRNALSFFLLWAMYLSVVKIGQVFLWFQWDILLLEAGFIAFLLSSFGSVIGLPEFVASDRLGMWLTRWLLFRLMFASGVVKLTSNCPTWWGLKALHHHYQSQCIPTPLAWYFHHLPGWFHSFCVAATFIIEIFVPFLFFVPLRTVRLFSFYSQVLLQALIILTGNYNFFNLATIALCYSLLKSEDFSGRRCKCTLSGCLSFVSSCGFIITVLGISGYLFNISISNGVIHSSIVFSKAEFAWFVQKSVTYSMYLGVGLFFVELFLSLIAALSCRQYWRKLYELIGVLLIGSIGLAILFSSLVPFSSLEPSVQAKLSPQFRQIQQHLKPFYLTNSYGLFRRMTGVGGRPELVLEGGPSVNGPWTEYQFYFKPGPVHQIPPVVIPHQPRLDWQMWFAALSDHHSQPWFMNFVYRLLQHKQEVLELLPPIGIPSNTKFLRASLYTYHFTDLSDNKNWWRRKYQSEYLQPVSLSSDILTQVVKENGLLTKQPRTQSASPSPIPMMLDTLRQYIGQPHELSPLILVCVILQLTKLAFHRATKSVDYTKQYD